ncbi:hypothetical protein K6V78_09390 [Streptococcus gallolyticus]|nr:hypothetical protein [Streptococcus gallolyticus]MBY5041712.1 hypothetical protein [Streptococcus gallolyticus]
MKKNKRQFALKCTTFLAISLFGWAQLGVVQAEEISSSTGASTATVTGETDPTSTSSSTSTVVHPLFRQKILAVKKAVRQQQLPLQQSRKQIKKRNLRFLHKFRLYRWRFWPWMRHIIG